MLTKRGRMLLGGGAIILALFFFLVPIPFGPPGDLRIILDHTLDVYIAPPCFEQSNATNYLTETTWKNAREKGYRPESACTATLLQPAAATLWSKLQESLGIIPGSWSW